ncbi:MAG: hypothetical protein HY763_08325 [Planctomycetes bacterium]|nr:hypothetical protein [Planctomycetota bacterium]
MKNAVKLLLVAVAGVGFVPAVLAGDVTSAAPENAAQISMRVAQSSAQPGGTVAVDVFVSNAKDMAVFQLRVEATGGDRGSMKLDGIKVAKERPDFVFGTAEILDAADMVNGRVGALRYNGGNTVDKPAYLATFTFKASDDAQGTFRFSLKEGDDNFLNDSNAILIPHKKGAPVEVSVGKPTAKTREEERGGRK